MQTHIGKMKINLAGGTGPMGKVHKPLFENQGHEVIISGRKTSPTLEEAAQISDLTIVSVPIPYTEEMIKRIGHYCNAMMDFTGLKTFPIHAMQRYTRPEIEIGGLHPMYGDIQNLTGKTVVYCPTERSGKRCEEIIKCFKESGLIIKTMDPTDHDLSSAIAQNARIMALEIFGSLLITAGMSAKEAYEFSPPPTRVILDLLARQINPENDQLYKDMMDYNQFTPIVRGLMTEKLSYRNENVPKAIREMYGPDFLRECQERAKFLVDAGKAKQS
ncbi:Prephenate dehydrogenase [uncultured archaeon]|nr:Prephenate dehydrogenase [uncultured archaeon]